MKRQQTLHQRFDIFVLVVLAGFITAYLYQVLSASTHVLNTILILPVSVLVLALCLVELINLGTREEIHQNREPVRTVLPVMGLFVAYVITLPWFGFDVGSALFVSLFLLIHGEKRWHWAIAYGVTFGILVALLFSFLLPYPMPMLLLPTEY